MKLNVNNPPVNLLAPIPESKICDHCFGRLYDQFRATTLQIVQARKRENLPLFKTLRHQFNVLILKRRIDVNLVFEISSDGKISPDKADGILRIKKQMTAIFN